MSGFSSTSTMGSGGAGGQGIVVIIMVIDKDIADTNERVASLERWVACLRGKIWARKGLK